MPHLNRLSLSQQVADLILENLIGGRWAIGEKIPGEHSLSTEFGVSRSTIREAIRHLTAGGVLSSKHGVGAFVTALEMRPDIDGAFDRAAIEAVIEARMAVESEAARLAADRRTPEDIKNIESRLKCRESKLTEMPAHIEADIDFHRAVLLAADNPILVAIFDGLTPRLRAAMTSMIENSPRFVAEDDHHAHADLVRAIIDGDGDRASELSRSHLGKLREIL